MASIRLTFHQVQLNYPTQMNEVMTKIQNSRSQNRNIAPEDLNWTIEYAVAIEGGLRTFNDIFNPQPRPPARQRHMFWIKASYRHLYASSEQLNFTPPEFTDQQNRRNQEEQELERTLAESLDRANRNPQRMWLRLSANNPQNRRVPVIHAFPILAAFRDGRNNPFVVIDNYEQSKSIYRLDGLTAYAEEKVNLDRVVEAFENNPAGARVRVGKRVLNLMSQEETKQITDFSVYREDFLEMLHNMGGFMQINVPMNPPVDDDEEE